MRDDLLERMTAWVGDVTQPGREVDRAAVEVAASRITNVLHDGPATGSEGERGRPELYPCHLRYGSNAHLQHVRDTAAALKAQSPAALESIARQRGYYSHPVKDGRKRSDLVENYRPQIMESWDHNGEPVLAPVLGNGIAYGSKFDDLELRPPLERKRITDDVSEAPRLPSGELDMDKVCAEQNERYGHVTQSGRRNVTPNGIGPRLRPAVSKDLDEYPTADKFK
jgi:hypothetical protein